MLWSIHTDITVWFASKILANTGLLLLFFFFFSSNRMNPSLPLTNKHSLLHIQNFPLAGLHKFPVGMAEKIFELHLYKKRRMNVPFFFLLFYFFIFFFLLIKQYLPLLYFFRSISCDAWTFDVFLDQGICIVTMEGYFGVNYIDCVNRVDTALWPDIRMLLFFLVFTELTVVNNAGEEILPPNQRWHCVDKF